MPSVSTYAARYSAYNNTIEHVWLPLPNLLVRVVFSPKMEGDGKPPHQQSTLRQDHLKEKTFSVFNKALSNLHSHWKHVEFDGNPVKTEQIKSGEDNLKWDDLENLQKFFKVSVRDLYKYSSLNKEFKDMFCHVDRHSNELVFIRCKNYYCCADWWFDKHRGHLSMFQFKVPAPVLETFYEGHFDTFLQRIERKADEKVYGNENQPTVVTSGLGKCSMCPNYRFSSKRQ